MTVRIDAWLGNDKRTDTGPVAAEPGLREPCEKKIYIGKYISQGFSCTSDDPPRPKVLANNSMKPAYLRRSKRAGRVSKVGLNMIPKGLIQVQM